MASDPLQSRADALAARVEAFAAALRARGVPDDTAERLLSRASAAALQALTLELLLEHTDRLRVEELGLPTEPETARERRFRLAA